MLVSNTSATFAYRKIVIVSIVVLVCAAMISGILYMTVPSVRAQLSSGPTTPSGSTIVDLMEEGLDSASAWRFGFNVSMDVEG